MSGGSALAKPPAEASNAATRSRFTPTIFPTACMVWMPIATAVPAVICEADFQPSTDASMLRSSRPSGVGARLVSSRYRSKRCSCFCFALSEVTTRSPISVCSVDKLAKLGSITPCASSLPILNCMSTGALLPGSPASGSVIVKDADGGTFTSSIDQRPPSSGRTFAVAATSPVGLVMPGIGQVMT